MTEEELARELRHAYDSAARNEAACQIHLFGIRYAEELQRCARPLREILKKSGIPEGYLPEISKGVRLARYVRLRERGEEHD